MGTLILCLYMIAFAALFLFYAHLMEKHHRYDIWYIAPDSYLYAAYTAGTLFFTMPMGIYIASIKGRPLWFAAICSIVSSMVMVADVLMMKHTDWSIEKKTNIRIGTVIVLVLLTEGFFLVGGK